MQKLITIFAGHLGGGQQHAVALLGKDPVHVVCWPAEAIVTSVMSEQAIRLHCVRPEGAKVWVITGEGDRIEVARSMGLLNLLAHFAKVDIVLVRGKLA